MIESDTPSRVKSIRAFTRFYTKHMGVLKANPWDAPLSLAEGRALFEIAQRGAMTQAELAAELDLDTGYVSRVLKGLSQQHVIEKTTNAHDKRSFVLSLTESGAELFNEVDRQSDRSVGQTLAGITASDQRTLVDAMETIEAILSAKRADLRPYVLRPPKPGDIGWVVHRHGVLYAAEYGWDATFEALVAKVAAGFIETFDPKRECCWIAERDDRVVGSAFIANEDGTTARLRLVYVEPEMRGLGIGRKLVEECLSFADRAGYGRVTLWTNDVLTAARALYASLGFEISASEHYQGFGKSLVGETWQLNFPSKSTIKDC